MEYRNLLFTIEDRVCRVTLNRPELHNAMNREMLDELRAAFDSVALLRPGEVRVVVLTGAGKSFSAGADVNWMRASLDFSEEENVADALALARTFESINTCRVPVIARIQGAALGGGVGLAAVADIVVAADNARFAFSEAKLGIAPAVISPYVLAKIGTSHARALFFTAERFSAERALAIGLVHIVVGADALDAEVDRLVAELKSSATGAITRAKLLIATVPTLAPGDAMQYTAETIAALRVSREGQEGLHAFLEKRKASWVE
ncbi:MAG: enoyl-CoA hydratase-related protein [Chloroflexota bacterium]